MLPVLPSQSKAALGCLISWYLLVSPLIYIIRYCKKPQQLLLFLIKYLHSLWLTIVGYDEDEDEDDVVYWLNGKRTVLPILNSADATALDVAIIQ
jgi:hypothetical protein